MKMIDVDVLKERALKDPEIKAGGGDADFLSPSERGQGAAPPTGRTDGSTGKAPPG